MASSLIRHKPVKPKNVKRDNKEQVGHTVINKALMPPLEATIYNLNSMKPRKKLSAAHAFSSCLNSTAYFQ